MAKTATEKMSDAFWGVEIEKILPNKFLREAVFVVVVVWGVAVVLAALLFNIYLLTSEGETFLTPVRVKALINFIEFSANVALLAFVFLLGCRVGTTRVRKRKSQSTEHFSRGIS